MENIFWAAPALILAAIVIGWAAETSQVFVSQGLALAVLAWLQTLPEFAVEAVIAWEQKQDLMIANLTGSLRLLVGLGWPLIYFTMFAFGRKIVKARNSRIVILLPKQNSLEVFMLLISTFYFLFIAIKGSLTLGDSFFLILFYTIYLVRLSKMPKGLQEEEEDLPWVGQKILKLKNKKRQITSIALLFIVGGAILNFSAHPFLHSMEAIAVYFGISTFVFIQWMAPFLSEFPEKVTAFNWARTGHKAPIALMNMVGSNIVQWTVMAGMIPMIYSVSRGQVSPIMFDHFQTTEILMTVAQSFLSVLLLMDLEIRFYDALLLFTLWLIQFMVPSVREEILYAYLFFIFVEIFILIRKKKLFHALSLLREFNTKAK
ncbi:MAG: hypothetical protein IPM57_05290 [Oligoflexia bacterium]|nr:hypothetical protein [Oligoflexia bacterium]